MGILFEVFEKVRKSISEIIARICEEAMEEVTLSSKFSLEQFEETLVKI